MASGRTLGDNTAAEKAEGGAGGLLVLKASHHGLPSSKKIVTKQGRKMKGTIATEHWRK